MRSALKFVVKKGNNRIGLLHPFVVHMGRLLVSPMERLFKEYPKVLFTFGEDFSVIKSFYIHMEEAKDRVLEIQGNKSLYCDVHDFVGAWYV